MILIVMGVSGSGKTTLGQLLADRLAIPFLDADDYHPPANRHKMARGEPLTDNDRLPWLGELRRLLERNVSTGAVLACSALKESYRRLLIPEGVTARLVYLKGDRELLVRRLETRKGHFMPASLIDSQLATLEEPSDALVLDAAQDLGRKGDAVLAWLDASGDSWVTGHSSIGV